MLQLSFSHFRQNDCAELSAAIFNLPLKWLGSRKSDVFNECLMYTYAIGTHLGQHFSDSMPRVRIHIATAVVWIVVSVDTAVTMGLSFPVHTF